VLNEIIEANFRKQPHPQLEPLGVTLRWRGVGGVTTLVIESRVRLKAG